MKDARQYTIPVESALEAVRAGKAPELTTREKHTRECFVVAEEGADLARIENEIKTMPNYFADYDTTVHFISEEELLRDHAGIPHGGFVLRSGKTGWNGENTHVIEYSLRLDSNPEFTSSVIVAYARAVARLAAQGQAGCKTVFDVPPALLCRESATNSVTCSCKQAGPVRTSPDRADERAKCSLERFGNGSAGFPQGGKAGESRPEPAPGKRLLIR